MKIELHKFYEKFAVFAKFDAFPFSDLWTTTSSSSVRARTEFEGLFLCGASTTSHGVAGVTASGIEAAKAALNCRTRDLLKEGGTGPRFLPAEDASAWGEVRGVEEEESGQAARWQDVG